MDWLYRHPQIKSFVLNSFVNRKLLAMVLHETFLCERNTLTVLCEAFRCMITVIIEDATEN